LPLELLILGVAVLLFAKWLSRRSRRGRRRRAGLYYVVFVAVPAWAWLRHPDTYVRARRILLVMGVVALLVYWAVPMSLRATRPYAAWTAWLFPALMTAVVIGTGNH
jgi:hypothetical protein